MQPQDPLFDAVPGRDEHLLDRPLRADAVHAGDALLEAGRVPGDVEIDDDVGRLEIETQPAGVGADEHGRAASAGEFADEGGPAAHGDSAVQVKGRQLQAAAQRLDPVRHVGPLGEDDRLPSLGQAEIAQMLAQLLQLGDLPVIDVETEHMGAVAAAARDHQQSHHPVEIGGQDHLFRGDARHLRQDFLIGRDDGRVHLDHDRGTQAPGEFGEHVLLAAAQEGRRQARAQSIQAAVEHDPASLLVPHEVIAVDLPERREEPLVDELSDGVRLLEAILEGRAGEGEHVARAYRLEHTRRPGAQSLGALCLVHDQEIGRVLAVLPVVAQDLLVVCEQPAGTRSDRPGARRGRTLQQGRFFSQPPSDLVLPAAAQAGRADDGNATRGMCSATKGRGGEDRLHRLAEAHLVGQERAPRARQELRPGPLVGVRGEPERGEQAREFSDWQDRPAAQAIVEPGEDSGLDAATEAREPEAQITLVPCERTDGNARLVERRTHLAGSGSYRRAVQPRFDHFAEVQVDPGPLGFAPEGGRQAAARGAQEQAGALHVLAGVQTVGLEVGAVAGMRARGPAAQVHPVGEPGRTLDTQEGGRLGADPEVLAAGGDEPFLDRPLMRFVRDPGRGQRYPVRDRPRGRSDRPRRGEALAQHQRRRHLVLAGVPPRGAGAAVFDSLACGPQRHLEIAGGAAHHGRHALGGADEAADAGLAGIARPLAQRLASYAGQEPVDRRVVDHDSPSSFP